MRYVVHTFVGSTWFKEGAQLSLSIAIFTPDILFLLLIRSRAAGKLRIATRACVMSVPSPAAQTGYVDSEDTDHLACIPTSPSTRLGPRPVMEPPQRPVSRSRKRKAPVPLPLTQGVIALPVTVAFVKLDAES